MENALRPRRGLLLGDDGELGQFRGGDADAFEALGHDAVGSGEQRDEQIHGRDLAAAMIACPLPGFAEQPNHVVGKKFAVEKEQGFAVAFFLVKQFLELAEKLGKVGAKPIAPRADARVGNGKQSHENVRAAEAVPASFAGKTERFVENLGGRLAQALRE